MLGMPSPAVPQRPRPKRGEEVEVAIDALAHGGAGVGRAEGFVVFVRGAVPGDRVRARIEQAKRSFAQARLVELLQPSAQRIEARSPQHPGAPWQVLAYEQQVAEKERQVHDAFTRLGGFEDPPVEAMQPALEQWRYRNKVEYSFGRSEEGELTLGFHRAGRWDVIDPIEQDLLASERVDGLRAAALAWCRAEGLSAYDRGNHTGLLRNLVVREGRRTGQLQVRLITSPGSLRAEALAGALDCEGLLWTRTAGAGETTAGGQTRLLSGAEKLEEELGGLRLAISPEAFFQTNTEMSERLYEIAGAAAALRGWERVFDLYCGIGTLGLTLAPRAGELWGVEVVEPAVADAIDNARANEIDNARFFAGDVRLALPELTERAGRPDVCVVDPPRAGLSKKVVRRVIEAGPARVVYVSCNPTTLAPNAAQLVEAGYVLRQVTPVDMFPQTPHIECVALLQRPA